MPRPRGGEELEEELRFLKEQGATTLVSLLESSESRELDLMAEPEVAKTVGLEFFSFPIPDHEVPPSFVEARRFIRSMSERMGEGGALVFHCRAGIGRSALVAAAVLLLQGLSLEEVVERLSRARGFLVPETEEQHAWLARFEIGIP